MTFDIITEFIYISSAFTTKNDVNLMILWSQQAIGKTNILQGAHFPYAYLWRSTNVAAVRVFERKILCKIFDPVQVGNDFHF